MVVHARLSRAEREARVLRIAQVITRIENETHRTCTLEQRLAVALWLYESPYTLRQIAAAAESLARMETYGRPLAREFWTKAFSEPVITSRQLTEIKRQAFEAGYRRRGNEEEREGSPEASEQRMDALTKRLLTSEQELWKLKSELKEATTTIGQLRRERKAGWKQTP